MSGEFNRRWRQPGDEAHTNIPALSNELLTPSHTWEEEVSPYVLPWGRSYWWAYDLSNVRTAKGDYIRWQLLKGKDREQVRSVGMPVLPSYNFSLGFSF